MSKIPVAFFGSHPLGERCLELLIEDDRTSVEIVVTYPPDHETWWDGSLYKKAIDLGLEVVPIADEKSVLNYDVDYLLSVLYPNILELELITHPKKLSLNLHQAELPRYRGSNTFVHSILNARPDDYWEHGTTLHVMTEDIDAGDIIDRKFVTIAEDDTSWSLYRKVSKKSVELFNELLPRLGTNQLEKLRMSQSKFDGPRYYYEKSSIEGKKQIPFEKVQNADVEVYDRIRAFDFPPHEPAYTRIQGKKVYLTLTGYQDLDD